ncbi:helix-turn-helix domain-containing protein [Zafaria sp. Z1313]|uniref:helix-turn-helix domain-containing protein n=1 Tax=Zafaria sp. Z1313 TaxID=3423202 RepID=UPI003D303CD0
MTNPQTISEAVGAYVARMRKEHGLTLDQVAGAARAHGATWSATSVSNIERGQASLTLPTLLFLAWACGDLLGRPQTLSDLLGSAEVLALGPDERSLASRAWVDAALNGQEVVSPAISRDQSNIDALEGFDEALEEEVIRRTKEQGSKALTPAERNRAFDHLLEQSQMPPEAGQPLPFGSPEGSQAEKRAAKKLGVGTARLQQLAQTLWTRSLEDESARRAGNDSTPQARGRVTRVLVAEMRSALDRL